MFNDMISISTYISVTITNLILLISFKKKGKLNHQYYISPVDLGDIKTKSNKNKSN